MKLATVLVDDRAYRMNPEQNLLHQCLSLGLDLPYFCWHPALGSVGACRQCAVKLFKDEKDREGRLVMACMTPAADGARISIQDPEAAAFRAGVIEGLMLNHPHDCPVCDEGGECHLQDMTVMTGHNERRYGFQKRTFRNQYLGPFLNHEMNRCIQCYRCVRFYREYAGGEDFNVFSLRDLVYFGRDRDGVLENEFAGNLVEVCPTGVFTDATLKRHYTRKWDLRHAPSICALCGLGCNISIGERYGMLRRVVNRFNGQVNGYFLCDRGRFGYEFVNGDRRIRQPGFHGEAITPEAAEGHLRDLVASRGGVLGIGSPRASLESNFALRKLVGPDHFCAGVPEGELRLLHQMLDILRTGPARTPSLAEVEAADAVFILGEDVTNVAPRMALSIRQSVRQGPNEVARRLQIPLWHDQAVREAVQGAKGPLFIAAVAATRLDDVAAGCYRGAPDDLARLGFAVAHELEPQAPDPVAWAGEERAWSRRIAAALQSARRPLVVAGASLHSTAIIQAAANVSRALPNCALAFLAPECNSFGLALLAERSLDAALASHPEAAIVLENDLYRRLPADQAEAFLDRCGHLAVLDHLGNRTTEKAQLLLPAATYAEAGGTLVNQECRAQRFYQVAPADGAVRESWRWLGPWPTLDAIIADLASALPGLADIAQAAPAAGFRMAGAKVPREPHRSSGRTAVVANLTVHEPKPPDDPDSPLSFSMEGSLVQPPSALIPFCWSPGWNSIQAANKYQSEIGEAVRGGDPGVRLIQPGLDARPCRSGYSPAPPQPFQARDGEWLLVPLFHVFGSEELSRSAPAVAQLCPRPYLGLNADDATRFGDMVEVLGFRLPVVIVAGLPRGTAGLPSGLPPLEGLELPAWSRIARI
ncbi:MAG: NADH-quinone oxidoreductase subunit NuoG [Holophaga sp.]